MSQKFQIRTTSSVLMVWAGVISGPFFFAVAIAQILFRPGFNIDHNAISQLSLGDLGWIQVSNFIVTGVLAIVFAVGMRRVLGGARGGTFGPVLVALYGLSLIVGGIFHPDPGFGFPPGAPAGMPTTLSQSGTIHQFSFYSVLILVIITSALFGKRFVAERRWSWAEWCVAAAVLCPALIVLTFDLSELCRSDYCDHGSSCNRLGLGNRNFGDAQDSRETTSVRSAAADPVQVHKLDTELDLEGKHCHVLSEDCLSPKRSGSPPGLQATQDES